MHIVETEFAPGQDVIILAPGLPGRVNEVVVSPIGATYNVSWWLDKVLVFGTFYANELEPDNETEA